MKKHIHLLTSALLMLGLTACKDSHDHAGHDHGEHADHAHGKGEHNEDGHEHEGEAHAKKTPGPNGGRLIESVEPHVEFLIREDRRVQITFLGDDLKPVPAGDQLVSLIGGDRSAPFHLAFAKEGNSLLSEQPIPEGNNHPGVLQIKANAEAKSVIEKFHLNFADCPTCEYQEYACICDHGEHEESAKP